MNAILKYAFASLALPFALIADSFTAPAPSALPPCIIEYSTTVNFQTTTRIVVYRVDSTFNELSVTTDGGLSRQPLSSSAPRSGVYGYAVDPQDPTHATISYTGVQGGLVSDNLYFERLSGGRLTAGSVTVPENGTWFEVFPLHANDSGGIAFSTRCTLAAGGSVTSGLAIGSGGPRWVLIRAVGASLATYGVGATVTQPSFTLYNSSQGVVGTSSVWSADPNLVSGYKTVFSMVGEFPLTDGSDEAVLLVALNPGTYTAVFKAATAGQILCEAYVLPY